MTADPEVVGVRDTVRTAAAKMADLTVGSLPVCGNDNRLKGMLTDRDIAIHAVAENRDPDTTTAGDLVDGEIVTVLASRPVEDVLATMTEHRVRRVPVIHEHKLVGIIALADVARALPDSTAGELVEALSVD